MSETICEEYLQDGVCRKNACSDRHPKTCRYWHRNPEGCLRQGRCDYLHIQSEKYVAIDVIDSNDERRNTCDEWQVDQNRVNNLRRHRETNHVEESANDCYGRGCDNENRKEEMEENYFATKAGDGKIMFTCKKCKASFASQKSVVQHNTAKHEGQGVSRNLANGDSMQHQRDEELTRA